jgi:hypothetical protein
MKPSLERERKLFDALKRITQYDEPDKLKRRAQRDYGLESDEAVEMAYENVLQEAKAGIRGMRRP